MKQSPDKKKRLMSHSLKQQTVEEFKQREAKMREECDNVDKQIQQMISQIQETREQAKKAITAVDCTHANYD
jgi:flagellar biosynthesis chaperone FliJ